MNECLSVAVPRQREEPELRRRDDTQLRQRRASQSVSCYDGSWDWPQHRITGNYEWCCISPCVAQTHWPYFMSNGVAVDAALRQWPSQVSAFSSWTFTPLCS